MDGCKSWTIVPYLRSMVKKINHRIMGTIPLYVGGEMKRKAAGDSMG